MREWEVENAVVEVSYEGCYQDVSLRGLEESEISWCEDSSGGLLEGYTGKLWR